MPIVNLPQKNKKSTEHSDTENRLLRMQVYNSRKWKDPEKGARIMHLKRFPVCEECLRNGITNAGSKESPLQVHHKKPFVVNGHIDWFRALDQDNLETLCQNCHTLKHNPDKNAEDKLKKLDMLLQIIDEI